MTEDGTPRAFPARTAGYHLSPAFVNSFPRFDAGKINYKKQLQLQLLFVVSGSLVCVKLRRLAAVMFAF